MTLMKVELGFQVTYSMIWLTQAAVDADMRRLNMPPILCKRNLI